MGLDAVELLMSVEEAFGFSIPDDEACGFDTAGKLYDYILEHRFRGRQEACLSSVTFYRVRRAMMAVLGMPRTAVRVPVSLATLIPTNRRRIWRALQKALALRLPELIRPTWVKMLGAVITIGLLIATAVSLRPILGMSTLLVLAPLAFVVVWGLVWLTIPLAVEFPADSATVGTFTKAVLARNYGTISDECSRFNDNEVWEVLRSIIVEQLGVRPSDVTKDSNFVKDLNLS
jgi:acyl carrier protein